MKRFLLFIFFVACMLAVLLSLAFVAQHEQRSLSTIIWNKDPLRNVLLAATAMALVCFVFGLATGDNSWVDRLWSILPPLYALYFSARAWPDSRTTILCALVWLWGARLTWNFAKKGGYAGEEDYRWAILRNRIRNPLLWQLFNLGFISLAQMAIIALFTSPFHFLYLNRGKKPDFSFWLICIAFVLFLLIETTADLQQERFQKAKKLFKAGGSVPERWKKEVSQGFISSGLFKYSRHPNYFGELGQWFCIALAGYSTSGSILAFAGFIVLLILFIGSTIFTESISASKYPAYANYQKRTNTIVIWPR
jgi:steroid 5-alpha reductase family enzyme